MGNLSGSVRLRLTLEDRAVRAETLYTAAGAHVLTIRTCLDPTGVALELHSTFSGADGVDTHAIHLVLGPRGHEPSIHTSEHVHQLVDPVLRPRDCVYEHLRQLIDVVEEHDLALAVDVDDATFAALERADAARSAPA